MSRRLLVLALATSVACAASAARADFSDNFDHPGGLTGWTSTGVVSTAQAHSGADSLYVAPGNKALVNIPGLSSGGVLTVEVYDTGAWVTQAVSGNVDGWRVGITPSLDGTTAPADFAGILVDQRASLNSQAVAFSNGTNSGGQALGGFFSPYYDGYNPADNKDDKGTNRFTTFSATSDDGSLGTGEWTKWEFDFDSAGNVNYFYYDPATGLPATYYYQASTGAPLNSFFVYGGNAKLGGTYVDDVNFTAAAATPEPASLSLLGLAAGGLLLKRRRRHA